MIEEAWLKCAIDPTPMVKFMSHRSSERKSRLFACACCRRIWHLLVYESSRTAVEVAEQYADGMTGKQELDRACAQAEEDAQLLLDEYCPDDADSGSDEMNDLTERGSLDLMAGISACMSASTDSPVRSAITSSHGFARDAVAHAAVPQLHDVIQLEEPAERQEARFREATAQIALLREIYGNPFRPVSVNPAWLTSTVLALATGIYEDKAFDRMAILADALQDAGCDNEDILNHCRQSEVHVRGCWVIDLLLAK